jgi:hypothetical protein
MFLEKQPAGALAVIDAGLTGIRSAFAATPADQF